MAERLSDERLKALVEDESLVEYQRWERTEMARELLELREAKKETIKSHTTMDADIWAKEFCRLNNAANLDMMRAWFANAIMCGYDHANNRAEKRLAAAVRVIEGYRDSIELVQDVENTPTGGAKPRYLDTYDALTNT